MNSYVDRKDIDELYNRLNNLSNKVDEIKSSDVSDLLKDYYDQSEIDEAVTTLNNFIETAYDLANRKQDVLVSGTNIKTVNNESLLGNGNITIQGGGSSVDIATSWGSPTSDTKVPSEKLTKTTFDTKVNKTDIDTAWNNTSSDSKIPSEKLVKSSLDNKVDKEEGKGLFSGSYADLTNKPIFYGTSATTATTMIKDVTTSSDYVLATGTVLIVKFTNAQTYSASANSPLQLKVNNGTAINVANVGTTFNNSRYHWVAGEVVAFVYDGTNFIIQNDGIASTTYYGVTKLTDSITSTSTNTSATPKSVKTLNDNKQEKYYLEKAQLIHLIDETISQLNNNQTLTGMHLAIKNELDLTTGYSLEKISGVYYITKNGVRTDISSYLTNGISILIDDIITTAEEDIQNRSKLGHGHSASEIDVISNWGGNTHQTAQYVFETIFDWISNHSGGGGSNTSRFFTAQAIWDSTNKYYKITNSDLPNDEWQQGDILAVSFPLETGFNHYFSYSDDTYPDYFLVNNQIHFAMSNPNYEIEMWHMVMNTNPILLFCEGSGYDLNNEYYVNWRIVFNKFAWGKLYEYTDKTIVDDLTSTSGSDFLSAKQGKVLNDNKLDKFQVITNFSAVELYQYGGDDSGDTFYYYCQDQNIALSDNKIYLLYNMDGGCVNMYMKLPSAFEAMFGGGTWCCSRFYIDTLPY